MGELNSDSDSQREYEYEHNSIGIRPLSFSHCRIFSTTVEVHTKRHVHGSRDQGDQYTVLTRKGKDVESNRVELERRCVGKQIVVFYNEKCERILA